MPRAFDRRIAPSDKDPLAGLLDFDLTQVVEESGELIRNFVFGSLDGVVAVIKELTGIDLSSWVDLFEGITNEIGLDLPSLAELNPVVLLTNLLGAFDGIDITSPGAVLATIAEALEGVPVIGDIIGIVSDVLGPLFNGLDFSGGFDVDEVWSDVIENIFNPLGMLANLVGGVIPGLQIPGLDGSKITSGSIAQGFLNITNIAAGIVSGVLGGGNIPSLDASKITTGTLADGFLPGLGAARDAIYQAIHGGSTTGVTAAQVKASLQAIPGGNLTGSVASSLLSGTLDKLLFPNITRDMSSDIQGGIDALINAFRNTPAEVGQAVEDVFDVVSALPTALFNAFGGNNATRASQAQAAATAATLASTVAAQGAVIRNMQTILDGADGFSSSTMFRKYEVAEFSTVGSYTYDIPTWASHLDVVIVPAGGSGRSMGFGGVWGSGGFAGSWKTARLERGVDIPSGTTQITGTVADGGAMSENGASGSSGGTTTATGTGWAGLSAPGGLGGTLSNADTPGKSPGSITFNDLPYIGGAQQSGASGAGIAPGGGGAGAQLSFGVGGKGGRARVWIVAYAPLPAAFTSMGTLLLPTFKLNTGVAQTDQMTAAASWSRVPPGGSAGGDMIIIRANSAFTSYVYLWVKAVSGVTNYELGKVTSGTKSVWKTGTVAEAVPFNAFSLTSDTARVFTVAINGSAFDSYNDAANTSSMGATYRNGGWASSDSVLPGSITQFAFLDTGTPSRIVSAEVATGQTTTSTTFADLATTGPSVTLNVPPSGEVTVDLSALFQAAGSNQQAFMGVVLSGSNTLVSADARAASITGNPTGGVQGVMNRRLHLTALTPGTTTFKAQYRTSASTATISNRIIIVDPRP